MCDTNPPLIVVSPPPRLPRPIAVEAQPTTDTCRVVNCIASAASDADLGGIAIYVHAFGYQFEKGATYSISFDSQFLPRNIILNNLQSSGNAAKSYLPLPVPHAFSESMDRCFIEKCS